MPVATSGDWGMMALLIGRSAVRKITVVTRRLHLNSGLWGKMTEIAKLRQRFVHWLIGSR